MKKYILSFAVMSWMAIMHAEVVHHLSSASSINQRGFTQECWEDTETDKLYADADCTQELNAAEVVTYTTLAADPITLTDGFTAKREETYKSVFINTTTLQWPVETGFASNDTGIHAAEFIVCGTEVQHARLKWLKHYGAESRYGRFAISVYVNGSKVYAKEQGQEEELYGVFDVPLPGLKTRDVVRLEVRMCEKIEWKYSDIETIAACLEYTRQSDSEVLPLVIKVDDKLKTWGEADPALTWHCQKGTMTHGSPVVNLSREAGEAPGRYAIHASAPDDANAGYAIAFVDGTMTINGLVHYDASKPTISQRGYAMECWQDLVTGYYYSDAECKTRKSPAEIFSYVKLSKDPYVGGVGFKCCDPSRVDDPEYDWAVETKYLLHETDTRFAEFEVYGADVKNARLKWYKDNWNYAPENNLLVSIYVNGQLVYCYDKDDESEPLFWRYAVPLPDLKTGDRVRFEVAKPGTKDGYFYHNTVFTACLEYERSGLAYVPLTIKVLSREKLEGEKDPELEWSIVEGSTLPGYDLGDIILKRDEGETPGKYTIHASRGENTDPVYDITFREGTFVIMSKEEAEFIEVATLDELRTAVNAYEFPRIKLVADINLNGMASTLCSTFHGTIEGDGHAVVGSTGGRVKCASLFDNADGALIQNIIFKDIRIDSDEIGSLGVIASEVTDCTFKNVTMDHVSVWTNESNAGTLAGKSNGCHFEQVQVNGCDVTVDSDQAGGLVGYSTRDHFIYCSTDEHSSVFADGATNDMPRARCGGLVGAGEQGEYIHCVNRAIVGGDLGQLGGIIGLDDGSKLSLCINVGMVVSMDESDFGPLSERYRRSELPRDMYRYGDEIYRPQYLTDDDLENVDSDGAIGGIVGHGENTHVTDCVNFGPFYGTSSTVFTFDGVAGIVGHAEDLHVESCANYGYNAKEGSKYMGGIVGDATSTIINNCFNATASAYGSTSTNGSIVGMAWEKTKVNNCLSAVAQRIVGDDWELLQGTNVFVDPATGNNYRLEADNETNEWEMMVNSNLMGSGLLAFWLNNGQENREKGVAPWRQNLNADGNMTMDISPVLDATHNEVTTTDITTLTHITDAEGLMAFAEKVNKGDQFACAVLDDDIVMPADTPWMPIGWSDSKFRGVFDGQGHSISGLNQYSIFESAGLFGTVHAGATIRNVTVKDSQITNLSDGGTAGIVGYVGIEGWSWGNVVIENCANYANVYASRHGGGILGLVNTKTENDPGIHVIVENCYNGGTITTLLGNSGLLCGWTKHNGYIRNCWSTGELRHAVKDGKGTCCPYSTKTSNNSEPEYMAGYDGKIDIKNCYIVNAKANIDDYTEGKMQDGVENISAESLSSGELCYKLNKGVVDGTQRWYQTVTGEHTDACPVLTKLEDGTNIVFRYTADDAFGYGNTSCEEIRTVILGIESFSEHPITDIDTSSDTSVGDLLKFINAARK